MQKEKEEQHFQNTGEKLQSSKGTWYNIVVTLAAWCGTDEASFADKGSLPVRGEGNLTIIVFMSPLSLAGKRMASFATRSNSRRQETY